LTIRAQITEAGGLCNQGDIATLLGVSRSRVSQLVAHPSFPAPVVEGAAAPGGRAVWVAEDVIRWRDARGTVGS
jgi:predicted DNA-binding transcriptional regulator AlpA